MGCSNEPANESPHPSVPDLSNGSGISSLRAALSCVGDNALLTHEDWQLFGLAREDVLEEIKRLSLKGFSSSRRLAM
jgi:hypothetical protein